VIRLRAHHLLCVLTFVGDGYTPAFVANLDAIVRRLAAGEPVALVAGPDDICAPLAGDDDHCTRASVDERDRLATHALAALGIGDGSAFDAASLARARAAFAAGTIRAACANCPWTHLCDAVAADDFARSRLVTPGR
jgi:hypothetical protein